MFVIGHWYKRQMTRDNAMMRSLKTHWPEYLIETFGLGAFMVAAGTVVTASEIDASPIKHYIANPFLRRIPIGMAMGLTAVALIYSPWGKRSGAHLNPAVTLTFFRLGKLTSCDAFFYVLAQFIGGVIGVVLVAAVLGMLFTEPPVSYVVTVPGQQGIAIAFMAEFLMSFGLMFMVLLTANTNRLAKFTGLFAGLLVATYIILEAPISGMSINPARTFASALPSQIWTAFWVYYFAPTLGMLFAAEVYLRYPKRAKIICGKLCPNSETPCICKGCCCEAL
jgi:aquaporin Z